MMYQGGIAKLDKKTGKVQTWSVPKEWQTDATQQSFASPTFSHVDGKVWVKNSDRAQILRLDLATNTWTRVTYPSGSPAALAYDVVADSKNNMYGMQMNNDKIWITDGKTLKTVWYDFPTKGAGCRRGHSHGW